MTAVVEAPERAVHTSFVPSFCCPPDTDPFDTVDWDVRDAIVTDMAGNRIFEQKNVEVPKSWSQEATNIVASKYFFGRMDSDQRERSVRTLIHRVCRTIADYGITGGYFDPADGEIFYRELAYLCLHQFASFNSPVWFNVGLHHVHGVESGGGSFGYWYDPKLGRSVEVDPMKVPQASACFILGMEDSIDSIFHSAHDSARLFKFGSGVGMDLSPLRSRYEYLSGGGKSSGTLSFGKLIDTAGGTIKSGGRTRRAAIMMTLRCDHPEAFDFTQIKLLEEAKAKVLIQAGYPSDFNGDAYGTVAFQNANLSLRVTDKFLKAAETGATWETRWVTDPSRKGPSMPANEFLDSIAKATWECGDPGLQFDDTIQDWHTCPNSGRINSSNPCSEFLFLDDTSCNLASLRLTKFLNKDNDFDAKLFRHAARVMFTAQEILVGSVSYPTAKVAEKSYKFRPLGLGYADLGALLMTKGIPYDSDEGRGLCSYVTSLMTGEAYLTSALIAKLLGPFEGFQENREPMLAVMKKHAIAAKIVPVEYQENLSTLWGDVLRLGKEHGYRNAQATVLAPTGTISFMMDCDTTGIEPELGLVKYKLLAGGGNMKIVNGLVPAALRALAYDKKTIDSILKYVDTNGCLEGCNLLKPDHLSVFDTSLTPQNGKRSLRWEAHVDMMAAAQPFISGAISKTINMPSDSTVDDVREAMLRSWRKRLKANAIYRDGSKFSQPLAMSKDGNNTDGKKTDWTAVRRKMPKERDSKTYHFSVGGHDGYMTVGLYEDGTPGELFVKMNKEGSTVSGLMDTIGILTSFNLQHGVPLEFLCTKLAYMDFEPRGFTDDPDIKTARSVVDFVFRWLEKRYVRKDPTPDADEEVSVLVKPSTGPVVTGPPCPACGSMTIRTGPCFSCRSCGTNSGGCG